MYQHHHIKHIYTHTGKCVSFLDEGVKKGGKKRGLIYCAYTFSLFIYFPLFPPSAPRFLTSFVIHISI